MNTKCPYCASGVSYHNPTEFSCGTPLANPTIRTQTDLCIDRQVAKEACEGLEKVAGVLGLRNWMDENPDKDHPELAEACIEKIRDLIANQAPV